MDSSGDIGSGRTDAANGLDGVRRSPFLNLAPVLLVASICLGMPGMFQANAAAGGTDASSAVPAQLAIVMKNDDWQSVMVSVGSRDGVTPDGDFVTVANDNVPVFLYPVDLFRDRFWSQSLPSAVYESIRKGAPVERAGTVPDPKRKEVRKAGTRQTAEIAEREAIRQFDLENSGRSGDLRMARHIAVLQAIVEKVGPNYENACGDTPLHVALSPPYPDIDILAYLLSLGADPNRKGRDGMTPLMLASKSGLEAQAQLLLEQGADPDARDEQGRTALMKAAYSCTPGIVRMLLDRGAEPDARDAQRETALFYGLGGGCRTEKVVGELLAAGADVDAGNCNGETPLLRAKTPEAISLLLEAGADIEAEDRFGRGVLVTWEWRSENESAVRILCEAGADPDVRDERDGKTPLMKAVERRAAGIAGILIEHGADVLARDQREGRTALSFAAGATDAGLVRQLLAAKSDPNARDKKGRPPIWWAINDYYGGGGKGQAVVRELIDAGADPNAVVAGKTLLMVSASGGPPEIIPLLLSAGAGLDTQVEDGWTAVASAASSGNLPALELLLARKPHLSGRVGRRALSAGLGHPGALRLLLGSGIPVDSPDEKGETILVEAAGRGNVEAVRVILAARPELEAKSLQGSTALFAAVRGGFEPVVRALVGAGSVPSGKDQTGLSPLILAVMNGNLPCTRALLEGKVDLTETDAIGRTPLTLARLKGNDALVAALLAAGAK